MKAVGLAIVVAFLFAFMLVFAPKLMPGQEVSGANTPPDQLKGAIAVTGHDILIEGRSYRVERLTCPAPGTVEGDAALKAMTTALASDEIRCLPMDDTTVRCALDGKDLAEVMQDQAGCTKN